MFVYPSTDLERVSVLRNLLGSFWTSIFSDQVGLNAYFKTMSRVFDQAYQNYSEVIQCSVRLLTPVFHKELCQVIKLNKSAKGLAVPRYDDTGIYYDNGLIYDQTFNTGKPTWAIDSSISDLSVLVDSIDRPSVMLVEGVDFFLTNGNLQFVTDPFNSIQSTPEGDDETILLFALDGKTDRQYIRDHWGYVVDLSISNSSQAYLDTVNAILDSVVSSPSTANVRKVLESACGCDLVRNRNETVEGVYFNGITRTVVTDKESYSYPEEAVVEVAIGDVVSAGDALTDRIKIYDINQGDNIDDLEAIILGEGTLLTGGQLIFYNQDVLLEVIGSYSNGCPKIRFNIGGHPSVIEVFWAEVDYFSETVGITVAHYLSGIYDSAPAVTDLPIYVNPLEFVCRHVLRWGASVARIKPISQSLSRSRLVANLSNSLRQVVPAEGAVLVIVEMKTLNGEADNQSSSIGSFTPAVIMTGEAVNQEGRCTASSVRGVYR